MKSKIDDRMWHRRLAELDPTPSRIDASMSAPQPSARRGKMVISLEVEIAVGHRLDEVCGGNRSEWVRSLLIEALGLTTP